MAPHRIADRPDAPPATLSRRDLLQRAVAGSIAGLSGAWPAAAFCRPGAGGRQRSGRRLWSTVTQPAVRAVGHPAALRRPAARRDRPRQGLDASRPVGRAARVSGGGAAGEAVAFITEEEAGVRSGATIMVNGAKVTRGGAAFANSEMMLAGGKWDTFRMLTHPGTSILPAAFAAAETAGASGKEFITGLAAGYEVMERMAADFIPTVMARGFHAGPVFGIFGAAVAAAKIMRFTEDQVNAAIGLCVNLAGGNLESGAPARRRRGAQRHARRRAGQAGTAGAARPPWKGGPASTTPTPATTGASSPTASSATRKPAWTRSRPTSARSGCSSRRSTASTRFPGYNIAHIDVTAKLCEEHDIRYEDVDRVEAVVNWLETQYPSPAFPTQREDTGDDPRRGSTRYYTAYGVVKRGFPLLLGSADDPPEVLELMKRVTIIPSHQMTLFGPRITIFTKDGKSYTKQGTGREFMWDFNEEARRIREVIPGPADSGGAVRGDDRDLPGPRHAGAGGHPGAADAEKVIGRVGIHPRMKRATLRETPSRPRATPGGCPGAACDRHRGSSGPRCSGGSPSAAPASPWGRGCCWRR